MDLCDITPKRDYIRAGASGGRSVKGRNELCITKVAACESTGSGVGNLHREPRTELRDLACHSNASA